MSHVVLINQLQWSCLSTAASRPSEIAPDRGKRLIGGNLRVHGGTAGRLREGRHTAERIIERR
jgi:hypothetical protein